MLTPWFGDV